MTKFEKGNIYILNFDTLVSKNVRNWEHNRPPDPARVDEISRGIWENKQCDGIIYVARLDGILICYDGIHRYEAIKQLMARDNSLSKTSVLVFELREATHGKVLDHFRILNRCIPVPELYMGNQSQPKIEIIRSVVDHYCSRFPKFFSTSRSPRAPNENRDIFTDKLSEIFDKLKPQSAQFFIDKLEVLNSFYRKKFLESTTISRNFQKCADHEFYLFFKREWHKVRVV